MTRIRIERKPKRKITIQRSKVSQYWSMHTHSRYSAKDALPAVDDIVKRAKELGYPALALTDHGNISGTVQLYTECKKVGIKPLPGSEIYLCLDRQGLKKNPKKYHACLVAYTTEGYRNLVHISSLSHQNYYYKPLLDLADLAQLHDEGRTKGLALTTGCFFGLVIQTLITEGYAAAKSRVAMFASWFDTYIEIQGHDIDHGEGIMSEAEIAENLLKIADELDLPVIITQDSHYVHEDDKPKHEAMKQLVSFGPDPDEATFPGDGFHLADEQWMQSHHSEEVYNRGIAGLNRILDRYDMYLEEMEEYNYRVPSRYDDPQKELQKRVAKALSEQPNLGDRYLKAMQEELDVVDAARMAGYLLFVAEVCDHMRETQMYYQIRGSAAGSLLCYLLKITDTDPLKWKLRFDRFLTKDRTKPPDIDIDIDSERRDELIRWIDNNYAVVQIATFGALSLNDEKGSLRVQYLKTMRQRGEEPVWAAIPDEDRKMLHELSSLNLINNYGVHAAGLVVCNTEADMRKYVPTMYVASSKTTVSQFDMGDVEAIGLVKLDVLGVKTLSVMRRTMEQLDKPVAAINQIPLTDRSVYRSIASGDTVGMFQLEGWTSARGVREMKPTKIADVIAAMALFRPGVINSGATKDFMAFREGVREVPQRHKIIMDGTAETYGILLYQDQVIAILRALGMGTDELNEFLKAVKASNKKVEAAQATMKKYEALVLELCHEKGLDETDIEWLWLALKAFAEYSFNRAHSTVYGLTAYRTAWLLKYHPLEYHAAMLSVYLGGDKEQHYVMATRNHGIRLLKPDVNISGFGYAVDYKRNGIARGLNSIKGVGLKAALEIIDKQPFTDMDDFVTRCNPGAVTGIKPYLKDGDTSVGVLGALTDAGALSSLGVS